MKIWLSVIILTAAGIASAAEEKPACPPPEKVERVARKSVYKDMPFQPGERAEYKVSYAGIHAGSGLIGVRPPTKVDGIYHRQFYAEARTGEWYESIFTLKDKIVAKSQPWDFGVRDFYIEQDEGALFSSRYVRKKWIDFNQDTCQAKERVVKDDKEKRREFYLERGANDALSAFFRLRTFDFKVGKKETIRVYTSEKNWTLEAEPLLKETIKVKAGSFAATKLKLQTYLGEELQQKGDLFMWIADSGDRPMVRVEADVKVGSFKIELESFRAGKPL